MNSINRSVSLALGLGLVSSVFAASSASSTADSTSSTNGVERRSQSLSAAEAPKAEREIRMRRIDRAPQEKEVVTFLGVETAPVSPTLVAQLNLPNGSGLVVLNVVPDSGAAAALKEHDILLKLDDQILIDQHQLSVLVRHRKEGEEVTLTYVRAGQSATAKVKLTKREVPKVKDVLRFHGMPGPGAQTIGPMGRLAPRAEGRDIARVLSLIDETHGQAPARVRIESERNSGFRATRVLPEMSNLVYSDELGSLELKRAGNATELVAKDAKGTQIFSGPVSTPEERAKLAPELRERLEKLEAMQNVTFQPDDDFEGARTIVGPAAARPIAAPAPAVRPLSVPRVL